MSESDQDFGSRVLAFAALHPDRRAIVCGRDEITYGALAAKALKCAARFQQIGLEPGGERRVGLLCSPGTDLVVVTLGGFLAGVTVVPLPGLVAPDALARMIADADLAILFHDDDRSENVAAAAASLASADQVKFVPVGAKLPVGLETWLEGAPSFVPVEIDDEWSSDLIYSSGTTGEPKGVSQTYAARREQCATSAAFGIDETSRLLQTVGLYSMYGFTTMLMALWAGSTLFAMRKFSADDAVAIVASENVGLVWCPPATMLRMMEADGFAAAVAGRSITKLSSGAPISEALKLKVLAEWPGPFFDVFGQSETGVLTVLPVHDVPASKIRSVGKVVAAASIKILDDHGIEVSVGNEGEIVAAAATLMKGYHRREAASAAAYWYDAGGRRYVRTGDIGKVDIDGFLWICDRKKDMIITGGFNIFPADIEAELLNHPAVFEAGVVGLPSLRWGESPVAFVSLRKGMAVDAEDLREWANGRLGKVQRLAALRILPELPNGTLGKILKRELRERYADAIGTLA